MDPISKFPLCLDLFQSESKCEVFVMVISSNFNMNEDIHNKDLAPKTSLEIEPVVISEMAYSNTSFPSFKSPGSWEDLIYKTWSI